jgi:hypothetical protein
VAKDFDERIAASIDHRLDAVCAVRPPGLVAIGALGAGVGAGIGSVVGGSPLWAGVGGGVGALVGSLIAWLLTRGTGLSLGMALALTADRLELHRLNLLGTRAVGLIRAVPYPEIRAVEAKSRLLEIRITVVTDGAPLVVHTGKYGIGEGTEFADLLKRRIAP